MMSHIPSAQLLAQVSKSALGVRIGRTHPEDGPGRALDRDAWTTTSTRERAAAGREALVEDGPGLLRRRLPGRRTPGPARPVHGEAPVAATGPLGTGHLRRPAFPLRP